MEAEDAAEAALGLGSQQRRGIEFCVGGLDFGKQRGKVVVEGEDAGVGRVVDSAGTDVAGAEITGGIVGDAGDGGGLGGLALPGTLGALRGDEDPLAEEGIVAAVRDEVERARRRGHGGSFGYRSRGYKCKRWERGGLIAG
jgi:hypothetical protein